MREALKADQLRRLYDLKQLNTTTPGDHQPIKAIIGQDRAVKALQFGLGNKATGFNVYVSGNPSEGIMEAVQHFLENTAQKEDVPRDWCYVNNFQDPYCPKILSFPYGGARIFQAEIKKLVEESRQILLKAFESEAFAQKRDEVQLGFRQKEQELFAHLDQQARTEQFIIKRTPVEIIALPLVDGKPMTDKDFFELNGAERASIQEKQERFKQELKTISRKTRELERQFNQRLQELEQKIALFTLETPFDELLEKYQNEAQIVQHLNEIKADVLEHLVSFLQAGQKESEMLGPLGNSSKSYFQKPTFKRYEVNVLVDNTKLVGAPIIMELNPTYHNLFGKIEKEPQMGALITDFTLIRPGALHTANGGYLILPVEDLLQNPLAWDSLKRALKNRHIAIEEATDRLGFLATKSLKPQSIPLNIQIILFGRQYYYYLLFDYDDDFTELFKVKADFDNSMLPTPENIKDFSNLVGHVCKEENLLQVDVQGLARILEYAHRLAESQKRLSTRFGFISDLIREANHYAKKEGLSQIGANQIKKAIEEKVYRSGLYQEKYHEWVKDGTIILDLEGETIGQINGLSVVDLGDIAFGHPTRITASISVGKGGVLDIEREAKLGGALHTKGVLILSGYISELFGQDKPLSLTAQIVFEQSYGYIEGDSASSAELYALLSALAQVPLKQSIAVTGSVNQKGMIQAVGGINEKIEGFFELCHQNGLTGEQGVLIPDSNIQHLMLKEEVVQAVAEGQFHIWAVKTIQEGIEVLTGIQAGLYHFDADTGAFIFEKDSIFDRINKKLIEMTLIDLNYGKEEEEEEEEE